MKKSLLILALVAGSVLGAATAPTPPVPPRRPAADAPVTRQEFNALRAEVGRLKAAQAASRRSTNAAPARPVTKPAVSPR